MKPNLVQGKALKHQLIGQEFNCQSSWDVIVWLPAFLHLLLQKYIFREIGHSSAISSVVFEEKLYGKIPVISHFLSEKLYGQHQNFNGGIYNFHKSKTGNTMWCNGVVFGNLFFCHHLTSSDKNKKVLQYIENACTVREAQNKFFLPRFER